jgi:hypothetical protein
MNSYRKVELYSGLFNGYSFWMDISKYKCKEEIINAFRAHLINFCKTYNLNNLEMRAIDMNIVMYIYEDSNDILKKTSSGDKIYLYEDGC